MGESGRIKRFRPFQCFFKGAAVSTLISHGPDHHAGTVFVTLHAAPGTIHCGLCIQRIIRNDFIPAFRSCFPAGIGIINICGSVTFVVRLIDDKEAQAVIKLIKMWCIGIMTGADGIHIMLFHQDQIFFDLVHRDGKTCHRITVVAVGSMEFDFHAVDVEYALFRMDLADSYLFRDGLFPTGKDQLIKVRILCTPKMGIFYRNGNRSLSSYPGKLFSLRIRKDNIDRDRFFPVCKINGDGSFLIIPGRKSFHKIVLDSVFRTFQKIHVTENTAHTEFILIFKITSVAPLHHQNSQGVFTLPEQLCHIKLTGGMGNLAVTHEASIHPYIETGIHTLKVQVSLRSLWILLIEEIPDISTAGIHYRNIRRIHRERIAGIGILVAVIAVILPDPRHFHLIKSRCVIAIPEKFFLHIINVLKITELPVSGKQLKTVGCLSCLRLKIHGYRSRNIIGTVRHGILVKHVQVFEILWYDHVVKSLLSKISCTAILLFTQVCISIIEKNIRFSIARIRQNMDIMIQSGSKAQKADCACT